MWYVWIPHLYKNSWKCPWAMDSEDKPILCWSASRWHRPLNEQSATNTFFKTYSCLCSRRASRRFSRHKIMLLSENMYTNDLLKWRYFTKVELQYYLKEEICRQTDYSSTQHSCCQAELLVCKTRRPRNTAPVASSHCLFTNRSDKYTATLNSHLASALWHRLIDWVKTICPTRTKWVILAILFQANLLASTRMHARTHARMHARTHAHTQTHTHTIILRPSWICPGPPG